MKTTLPCCGYAVKENDTGPVFWNKHTEVVQCHNCGWIYRPDGTLTEQDLIENPVVGNTRAAVAGELMP